MDDLLGYSKFAVATPISAAIAGQMVARAPHAAPMMAGYGTIASFGAMTPTIFMGGHVLRKLKKLPGTRTKNKYGF